MTKYFKRGTREYYQVTSERVIRLIVKAYRMEITIEGGDDKMGDMSKSFMLEAALEGVEISKEEFKIHFSEAASLIVLE